MRLDRAAAGVLVLASVFMTSCTDENAQPTVRSEQAKQPAVSTPAESENPIIRKYGGTLEDPCGHLEGPRKKDCNCEVINVRDRALLKELGFTGEITINGYGRQCEPDGTVSGNWKGSASAVSYRGVVNGVECNVCIEHSGKTSNPKLAYGPVPVPQAKAAPAPAPAP